jgi:hypothetical protein
MKASRTPDRRSLITFQGRAAEIDDTGRTLPTPVVSKGWQVLSFNRKNMNKGLACRLGYGMMPATGEPDGAWHGYSYSYL